MYSQSSVEKRKRIRTLLSEKGIAFASLPIVRRAGEGRPALSFSQQRQWILDQFDPGNASYNIPIAVRLTGALDLAAFEASLTEVVRRHEALRTTFAAEEGVPFQVISPAAPVPVPLHDLSGAPAEERLALARSRVALEAGTPFDLACGPLIRAGLIRLAPDDHICTLTVHHIVSDGWSMGVLVKELAAIYGAAVQGKPSPLPEIAIQYADFSCWQQELLSGEVLAGHIDYWTGQLSGADPVLTLPTDRPRPTTQSHRGANHTLKVEADLLRDLHALCVRYQASLFMVLNAAYALLLARYSRQDDICIGTFIANRNRAETEGLIGFFVNTLVLRNRVDMAAPFDHLLQDVRTTTLGAYAHQDLPFEYLLEALRPERSASHTPLFQAMLILQNTSDGTVSLPGLKLEAMRGAGVSAKFDLTLECEEKGGQLFCTFDYPTALFDAATVERMGHHFKALLSAAAADPTVVAGALPMLSRSECSELLDGWNQTAAPWPSTQTLHQLFEAQVARTPDHSALVCAGVELSYAQLNARANALAHHLRTLGVGPNVLVGLCMERSAEMIVGLLAVLKAGGAYVPLDPAAPPERLAFMLADAAPVVLLTQSAVLARLASPAMPALCLDTWHLEVPVSDPVHSGAPANLAYVIYTSGSTGKPKGVLNSHANVVHHLTAHTALCGIGAHDRVLQFAALTFDASVEEIFPALTSGATLVLRPVEFLGAGEAFARFLAEQRISVLDLPTAFWHEWTQALAQGTSSLPDCVRLVIVGGEKVAREHLASWQAVKGSEGVRWLNTYGPTEATVSTSSYEATANAGVAEIPIGRPLANTTLYLLDAALQPVPVGVTGELHIGGAGLADGYLHRPDLTAERFIPHPFSSVPGARLYQSGDLARYRADGNIEYVGRIDDQVKLRGFRIELGEIEATLAGLPGVEHALVMVRQFGNGDERLVAYLVGAEQAAEHLRERLQASLPEYMLPSHYVFLERLPLNASGKVERRALPMPDTARSTDNYSAPEGETETALAAMWAEALKTDRVGRHDNFFTLGGHSLMATQVVSRVRAQTGIEVPLRALFQAPTIAGLAMYLTRLSATAQAPILPVPRDQAPPLSYAQQRFWFLDQIEPGNVAYNLPAALRLVGALDADALTRTLGEIVRRHEPLRTSFRLVDGAALQVIEPAIGFKIALTDLSALPHGEREARVQSLAQDEARTPFDLAAGPLIRARLLRLATDEHVFLLTMHHIVSDGWSMGVLVREVAALYTAFVNGHASPLPELAIQYADFAHWQRQWLAGDDRQLAFWKRQLDGAPAVLALPTDRPRPPMMRYRGARHSFAVPGAVTAALESVARQSQATLFMALHAAFNVLLARYSGQDDICIGTPIANRNRAETEPLIGVFINTLVLRTRVRQGDSFASLLGQVRESTLDAYEHQDLPFEHLVDAVVQERTMSHSPLFQVMLVLQNAPMGKLELPGLELRPVASYAAAAKFDLTLTVIEGGDALHCTLEYATDLFDAATIERMARHFTRLLGALAAQPHTPVDELSLLDPAERGQLLVEWNPVSQQEVEGTMADAFERRAAADPDAIALVLEGAQMRYGQLNERANRLAHHLRSLGVGPEVLVAICGGRSMDMIVGLLAILKAGGAYLPLDPSYPAERIAYMLGDAAPAVVLAERSYYVDDAVLLDDDSAWAACSSANPAPLAGPDNLAYVIYTSGSTGKPKGALLAHRNVLRLFAATDAQFGFGPLDTWTLFHSYAFDFSVWEIWGALLHGGKLVIVPYLTCRSPELFHALLAEQQVTVLNQTPSAFQQLVEYDRTESTSVHLRQVIFGGEALNAALLAPWFDKHGDTAPQLVNMYGITETTVHVTYYALRAGEGTSVGRPLADLSVYLLDGAMNPVPVGVAGELYVGGDGLARGYLNRAQLTAERFIPHPFSTVPGARLYRSGDLARFLADGSIEYLGRIDAQVKIRGFRIELGEIEAALAAQPQVSDVAVLAREQRLVAYIVGVGEELDVGALRSALAQELPDYMLPSAFVTMAALPLTPNGKIDRKALPAPALDAGIKRAYEAPLGDTEVTLAAIWCDVLKCGQVGRHDNFFELGGHSLLAVGLIDRMRRAGLQVDVRALFGTPTIAALAAAVGQGASEVAVPANAIAPGCGHITPLMLPLVELTQEQIDGIAATVPGGAVNIQDIYPLAPLQEGILFHHLMNEKGDAYLLPIAIGFDSRERLDGFLSALQVAIDRHDILRTAVLWEGLDEAVQVVWREAPLRIEELDFAAEATAQLSRQCDPRQMRIDVREAPLMRAYVAQDHDNGRWLLQILAHHLAIDHTTMEILIGEIEAILAGRTLPPALPFRNYVAQARLGVSQAEHEQFFRTMLADIDEPTAPFGRLDVRGDGSAIVTARRPVDAQLAPRIREQARALGVSAAALVHQAWAQVLAKTSGREAVVFGTVLFGRMQGGEGADRALGMFINTLPVRIDVSSQGARDSVRATHARLNALLRHEHASLSLAQRCSGVAAPAPLFSSLFNFRHTSVEHAQAAPAWDGMTVLSGEERTNFPLTVSVDDLGAGFLLEAQAVAGIDAERVCGYLHTALENLVAALETAPHTPACMLDVLPASERRQILVDWNATATPYPHDACIHQLFERQAARTPDAMAVLADDDQLSYHELNARANRLARCLQEHGVRDGDCVGIALERSADLVIAELAVLKAGGVYVPLDAVLPLTRQEMMLADCDAALVIARGQQSFAGCAVLDVADPRIAACSEFDLPCALDAEALAYIMFTSGSSGTPKGVEIPHRGVNRLAIENGYLDFCQSDHVAFGANPAFDASTMEVWGALLNGGCVVVIGQDCLLDPVRFSAALQRHRVNVMLMTVGLFNQYADALAGVFGALRYLIVGGDVLDAHVVGRVLRDNPPANFLNGYGPTEATTFAATYRIEQVETGKSIPLGHPIGNTQIYILDAHGQPVPPGACGEIHIGGAGLARGYLNRPDLTAERFVPDPFAGGAARMYRSGDLGRYQADGCIEFLGRNDFQVKIRGFRIELGEIDAALQASPHVREAVVLARDVAGEKRLVAYFAGDAAIETVRGALLQTLPDYMVPAHFVKLPKLPLTANGKVDRKALPAPDMEHRESAYVAPRNDAERQLASIWAEVLKLERIGAHDNFFALGGHSLLATQVVSRLRAQAGIDAPLRLLFETPTLAVLAERVGKLVRTVHAPMLPVARDQRLALSFAQQRFWFFDQVQPGNPAYNIPSALRLTGTLDVAALERTLVEIVRRHESLRTTFSAIDGMPVQVIAPELALTLPLTDLSALPHGEREVRMQSLAQDEARAPFDLAAGPLIRATLLRLDDSDHVILFTLHHIVADGWSMGVLVREVAALYAAFVKQEASPLAELPLQYADYAHWQRQWLSGEAGSAQRAYWSEQLSGAPAVLALPTDRARPPVMSLRGASHAFFVPGPVVAGLARAAQQSQATMFMALGTAFSVLLARYTGQDDICIGTPIANRSRAETEALIGVFINTLVLRTRLGAADTFATVLRQVRETTLAAYEHQDLPFEQLVETMVHERTMSHAPLVQVMLVLQNAPMAKFELPGLELRPVLSSSGSAKFDLTLTVIETGGGMHCTMEYATDLFDAATIERMARHFAHLLELLPDDPQRPVAELPLLDEAERAQQLLEWNPVLGQSVEGTIADVFERRAGADPAAVALVCDGAQMSYGQLNERANRLAHHLRSLGVGPDVLVAICAGRSMDMIVGLLAILKAGGAYLPIDLSYPAERIAYMLDDAAPAVVLAERSQSLPDAVLLDDDSAWATCSSANPAPLAGPDNLAYVIYTSGSTGKPKGALLAHRNVLRLFAATDAQFGFGPLDTWTLFHSYAFDFSVWEIWGALLHGGKLVIVPYLTCRSPDLFHALLAEQQVTVLNQTPSAFQQLVEYDRTQSTSLHLRQVIFGGEALNAALLAPWFDKHGDTAPQLVNMYGITETTVHVTYYALRAGEGTSVGRPLADLSVYLLDGAMNPVPVGVAGELYVGGDGLARGYLNRAQLTAERFIPHPFSTVPGARLYRSGDLARFLADGSIEYLDRIDDQVKIRGFRIELGEIEAALAALAQVREVAVLMRDERLVAYIVGDVDIGEVRGALLASLPDYMVPAHFVKLEALPLTPNGKVDKRALPEPDVSLAMAQYVAPRNSAEQTLSVIWAEVLNLSQVGVHDHFFALGGHSLLATQLVSRIRAAFGAEMPLRAVFEAPTLEAMAQRIAGAALADVPAIVPVARTAAPPLSYAQQRLWFLDLLDPGSRTYNIPVAVRLDGLLDATALERALGEVVRRHEALRTSFADIDGEPVQVIAPAWALSMPQSDLSDLPHAEREAKAQSLAQDEARTGFDLRTGPLLRASLIRLSGDEHILLVTLHHIVADGWSMGVLIRELAALYGAFRAGQASPLPELAIQYADYAQWQRDWLRGAVLERQLAYWKSQLAGAPALLALPTDRPRSAVQTYRGANHLALLPVAATTALQAVAARGQASMFMVLQAAFSILLARHSGQSDVCIGIPIANRQRGETESLIGFFVNTLVLRAQVQSHDSFDALLAQVRRCALDAYAHQDLPFEQLVDALQPQRQLAHSPLFQAMLSMTAVSASTGVPGLRLTPLAGKGGIAKFDLSLHVSDAPAGLEMAFEYSTDLFDAATVARMAEHFARLLGAIASNPQSRIGDLPMLSASERDCVLRSWNATASEYPAAPTVHQMVEAQAARTPQRCALVSDAGPLSYAQLNARANRLAHRLRAMGVGPDVVVGICASRSAALVVAMLATLKAGGAYLPLDPAYPAERLAYMLADATPAVLLTEERLRAGFAACAAPVLCLDTLDVSAESDANLVNATLAQHLVYVIYTSGSTGRPKGTAVQQRGFVNLLGWFIGQFALTESDKVLLISSFSFDLTQKNIFGVLAVGGELHLAADGYAPELLHAQIIEQAITFVNCAPSAFYPLLACHPQGAPWPLRQVFLGGEAINGALVREAFADLAAVPAFHNTYGPTEASDVVSFYTWDPANPGENIPVGAPVSNTELYVLDADMNPVPVGVAGELHVAGDGLARGYLHRPELTADRFVPNPFGLDAGERMYKTGDLARHRADGMLEYLGRIDNQVKIRGFRIELGEIEAALAGLPVVQDAAVLAREDGAPGDKHLVAYVVAKEGAAAEQLEAEALRAGLLAFLPEFMLPSHFVLLEALPLSPNGKVDRKALPAPLRTSVVRVAPQTSSEIAIAAIWMEILGIDGVGVHDDFFVAGGHSLLAVRVLSRIARELAVSIPVDVVFQSRTVFLLACYVDEVLMSRQVSITTEEAPEGFSRIRI